MPLARTLTGRSKSRSPIPPTKKAPNYLPPSHYAAAAGIAYTPSLRSESSHSSNSTHFPALDDIPPDVEVEYESPFMPVSYAPESETTSVSSFEFKSANHLQFRGTSGSLQSEKRQSRIEDLETQLLPSLRDTIDRMTRSPYQLDSGSHLGVTKSSNNSIRTSNPSSPSNFPTSNVYTTPIDSFPLKTKSSLNSALRTPRVEDPEPSLGMSSKSVHNMPTGKALTGSLRTSRSTGDGTVTKRTSKVPRSAVASPCPSPGASGMALGNDQRDTTQRTQKGGMESNFSGIPHPRKNIKTQALPFGSENRPHMKLADAEVGPSSSESDVDRKYNVRGKGTGTVGTRNTYNPLGRNDQVIGLGLDFDSVPRRERLGPELCWNTREQDHRALPQPSGFSAQRSRSKRQDDSLPFETSIDEAHRRRRAALMGIVSGLERDMGTPLVGAASEDSEYFGEAGIAISGSGDPIRESSGQVGTPCDYREEVPRDRRSRFLEIEEKRKSSIVPTFLVSLDNDDDRKRRGKLSPSRSLHVRPTCTPSPNSSIAQKGKLSRSPIISQSEPPPLPAALRRHSVYHRSQSPSTTENKPQDDPVSPRLRSMPKYREATRKHEGVNYGSSTHMKCREARPSGVQLSDAVIDYYGLDRRRVSQAPSHESDLSSAGSVYWDEDGDSELSAGAESLFKELGKDPRKDWESEEQEEHGVRMSRSNTPPGQSPPRNVRPNYDIPRAPSAHRLPEDPHLPPLPPSKDRPDKRRQIETQRQELIFDLYESQRDFVHRMQVFLQLFILPLRVQDSRTWISGVPSEVARLFDWLEDILVLHTQILSSLETTRDAQYPVVHRVAESIRAFVPLFEVYQPYLVTSTEVAVLIGQLMRDEESDFGEFMEIQQGAPECDGWGFEKYLAEPVGRLMRFPEFFTRLLELTPKDHPDYLSTFSLLHSMNMVIRVLTEVKIREEEYEMIKKISSQIHGLSPEVQLATRERRLLHQGILFLVDVDDNLTTTAAQRPGISQYFPQGTMHLVDTRSNTASTPDRSSRLANAINQWDAKRGKSGSTSSTNTGMVSLESVADSDLPTTPSSPSFSSFRLTMPARRLSKNNAKDSNKKTQIPKLSKGKIPVSPTPLPLKRNAGHLGSKSLSSHQYQEEGSGSGGGPGEARVHVFVFDDLVVFASPGPEPSTSSDSIASGGGAVSTNYGDRWTLLKHIGVVRILGVENTEEKEPPNGSLVDRESLNRIILLDVLPVDINKLNHADVGDRSGSVTTLRLAVPPPEAGGYRAPYFASKSGFLVSSRPYMDGAMNPAGLGNETDKTTTARRISWMSVFERCFQYTVCSIATPSSWSCSNQIANNMQRELPKSIKNADLALDTYQTVFSLLASGLPLPKSPSVQVMVRADQEGESDVGNDKGAYRYDAEREREREREERGWWSVRFRQVMRELQRRDLTLVEAAACRV